MKNFKSLYGFGGRCLKIRDVCMDFEAYFKVHSLVYVHPKSIRNTGQKYSLPENLGVLNAAHFCQIFCHLIDLCQIGVSLSICWNLKLAPVSCWISERPIAMPESSFASRPWGEYTLRNIKMESVPKELRNLRACLLCSLVKVGNFSERKTSLSYA